MLLKGSRKQLARDQCHKSSHEVVSHVTPSPNSKIFNRFLSRLTVTRANKFETTSNHMLRRCKFKSEEMISQHRKSGTDHHKENTATAADKHSYLAV
jgi:hypothetical protein